MLTKSFSTILTDFCATSSSSRHLHVKRSVRSLCVWLSSKEQASPRVDTYCTIGEEIVRGMWYSESIIVSDMFCCFCDSLFCYSLLSCYMGQGGGGGTFIVNHSSWGPTWSEILLELVFSFREVIFCWHRAILVAWRSFHKRNLCHSELFISHHHSVQYGYYVQ